MQADHQKVFDYLGEHTTPGYCCGFDPISRGTGLDRKRVRFICRLLVRKGLAEFHRGLWDDDGRPAGSGYSISIQGQGIYWDKPATTAA